MESTLIKALEAGAGQAGAQRTRIRVDRLILRIVDVEVRKGAMDINAGSLLMPTEESRG